MTIFALFLVEIMCLRYAKFGSVSEELHLEQTDKSAQALKHGHGDDSGAGNQHSNKTNTDIEEASDDNSFAENYSAQLTAILILEFGIIFHSIFIGLTLAVSGEEFKILYVVIVFHQTFEGLGLGSRLALTPFPRSKYWTPYVLGLMYGLTTPVAIAIGLGLRNSYPPGSRTTLIVNGVFDSISAGILIYTGLVELMAHEFMFSKEMRTAKISTVLWAYGLMILGAGMIRYPVSIVHWSLAR
jgi:zinc transporter 1/2/3